MPRPPTHKWTFRARFRRNGFGWKSQPAIQRVKEAVSEIKAMARTDQVLAAEGAVLFLEKVSSALQQVDSSSGSIGNAVNNAVDALATIISEADVDATTRKRWLSRLWVAYQDDDMPYIESLGDRWGDVCASPAVASLQADELIGICRRAWSPDPSLRGFFKGTTNCLSALLAAGRHDELLDLLETAPHPMWHYRQYGVRALAAQGRTADAIRYAEERRGLNDSSTSIARTCEEVLLAAGLPDEAYDRFGLMANRAGTYLAWFRAVARKYPNKAAAKVLEDLVAHTPGEEGKWFAAAKSAKLFDEAISLANQTPCSPKTLTRAARDFEAKNPAFAVEAGVAALHWIVEGYGYDITGADVVSAYLHTMTAAEGAGCVDETRERVRTLVSTEAFASRFVSQVLGHRLGLS
jgi:hypothetical protein